MYSSMHMPFLPPWNAVIRKHEALDIHEMHFPFNRFERKSNSRKKGGKKSWKNTCPCPSNMQILEPEEYNEKKKKEKVDAMR